MYGGPGLTWDDLVRREPRFAWLLQEIEASGDPDPQLCYPEDLWYERDTGFKAKMSRLVDACAERDDPVLESCEAYNVAYRKLYGALPACRHEGDCWRSPTTRSTRNEDIEP